MVDRRADVSSTMGIRFSHFMRLCGLTCGIFLCVALGVNPKDDVKHTYPPIIPIYLPQTARQKDSKAGRREEKANRSPSSSLRETADLIKHIFDMLIQVVFFGTY